MTIGKTRNLGISVKVSRDANKRRVLHAVIWYPAGKGRLGYLYPSITLGLPQ